MKRHLLSGAATIALVTGGMVGSAAAFDNVNWNWDLDITETITIDITIEDTIDITGLVKLQGLQIFIGDLQATAYVDGSTNAPIYPTTPGENGQVQIELGSIDWSLERRPNEVDLDIEQNFDEDQPGVANFEPASDGVGGTQFPLNVILMGGAGASASGNADLGTVTIDLQEFLGEQQALDAEFELPSVEAVATAFANAQFVETATATQIHHGQFAFGGGGIDFEFPDNGDVNGDVNGNDDDNDNGVLENANLGNVYSALAFALLGAAGDGSIQQGSINADAWVTGADNAQTAALATALANNHSVTVDAATAGDATLIQDLTQFAYTDVSATASNFGNTVTAYSNLAAIEGPLHQAVATAAGNVSSVTVLSPLSPANND
jgi:hypothetical protein